MTKGDCYKAKNIRKNNICSTCKAHVHLCDCEKDFLDRKKTKKVKFG